MIAIRTVAMALTATASAGRAGAERGPGPVVIDVGEDEPGGALGEQLTGAPPDLPHPSLMSARYRGIPDPATGDPIADPLASRAPAPAARTLWLGARLGGGVFDDGAAAARAGLALGVAARYRLAGAAFGAARADWSRRGGDAMAGALDVVGASAGAGVTVARPAGLALALIGELRGEVRLADRRADRAVRRAGFGLAAGAELALPGTPLTLGVRYEQGVTELVAGARDRAVLAELGVDLR